MYKIIKEFFFVENSDENFTYYKNWLHNKEELRRKWKVSYKEDDNNCCAIYLK